MVRVALFGPYRSCFDVVALGADEAQTGHIKNAFTEASEALV